MKIGITGGAGYIGSTLVKKLIEEGHEVVSVDNETIGNYDFIRQHESMKKAELKKVDIRDKEYLKDVWNDCEAVAHLAALPGLVRCHKEPEEAVSVNIFGTFQVLEAARELGIQRVVFCSSASVYGVPEYMPVKEEHNLNPLNLYGVTKLSAEKIMNTFFYNYQLETVNLRFGNIYGVGLYTRWGTVIPKFVKQAIIRKPLTIYGDGESSRDFVHVNDITNALTLSLTIPKIGGETFNVGGESLTINNIAQIVKEELGQITGEEVKAINTPPRFGETKEFSYDLTHIKEKLGFENKWTVRQGVNQLIKYRLQH